MSAHRRGLDGAVKTLVEVASSPKCEMAELSQAVVDGALDFLGGHSAAVWLPDLEARDDHLIPIAVAGPEVAEVLQLRLPKSTTSIGRVSAEREPLLLDDVPVESVPPQTAMLARVFHIRSAVMVPFADDGTLVVASERPHEYSEAHVENASLYAHFAAATLALADAAYERGRRDLARGISGRAVPLLSAALGEVQSAAAARRQLAARPHLEAAAGRLEAGLAKIREATGDGPE